MTLQSRRLDSIFSPDKYQGILIRCDLLCFCQRTVGSAYIYHLAISYFFICFEPTILIL